MRGRLPPAWWTAAYFGRYPGRPGSGRKHDREDRLADAEAILGSRRGRWYRTPRPPFAKLCRAAGGELEQLQLLLGHASVQTTERYLGTEQDHAPNDAIKLRVSG